jgi:hypothetical protein
VSAENKLTHDGEVRASAATAGSGSKREIYFCASFHCAECDQMIGRPLCRSVTEMDEQRRAFKWITSNHIAAITQSSGIE